jgi:anaerobic ribonucleoside-triphosphate reductase activating protein
MSADLFFKGCNLHCKGCHNLELQTFSEPNTSIHDIIQAIQKNNIKILTLMGGEPLDVATVLLIELLRILKQTFPELKLSLYTGHQLHEVPHELFCHLDYIKVGKYDCNHLNPKGSFLASSNQKFYRITEKYDDRVVLQEYTNGKYYVNKDSILYF